MLGGERDEIEGEHGRDEANAGDAGVLRHGFVRGVEFVEPARPMVLDVSQQKLARLRFAVREGDPRPRVGVVPEPDPRVDLGEAVGDLLVGETGASTGGAGVGARRAGFSSEGILHPARPGQKGAEPGPDTGFAEIVRAGRSDGVVRVSGVIFTADGTFAVLGLQSVGFDGEELVEEEFHDL